VFWRQQTFPSREVVHCKELSDLHRSLPQKLPDYLYYDPCRNKELITAPLEKIEQLFVPRDRLVWLQNLPKHDSLQQKALDIINLISEESGVRLCDLGFMALLPRDAFAGVRHRLRGYGTENFRLVEEAIARLVNEAKLSYIVGNRIEAARKFQGRYQGKIFMYNATKQPSKSKKNMVPTAIYRLTLCVFKLPFATTQKPCIAQPFTRSQTISQ